MPAQPTPPPPASWLCVLAWFTAAAVPGICQSTFQNPVDAAESADPWIVRHEGWYYYLVTRGNRVEIQRGRTPVEAAQADPVTVWTAPSGSPMLDHIWAPELHLVDGTWYIYTCGNVAGDLTQAIQQMFVLEADTANPLGNYTFRGILAEGTPAIDATVLLREGDGAPFLVWSQFEPEDNTSKQNIWIAPLDNPWTVGEPRVRLSRPEFEWETQGGIVNEAPQVLQRGGKTHIVYSASGAWTQYYCLGMLTNTNGDYLDPASWTKSPDPVFEASAGNGVYSVGHCSFTVSPDGDEDWILYHGTDDPGQTQIHRRARLQPFAWDSGDNPVFGEPESTAAPRPAPSESGFPGPVIYNGSFESDPLAPPPGYTGYASGWLYTLDTSPGNIGINDDTGPFHDNGTIPSGEKVLFIQQRASVSQPVWGLRAGHGYRVLLRANARSHGDGVWPLLQVRVGGELLLETEVTPVGGNEPYHHIEAAFFSTVTGRLDLRITNAQGPDDNTLLVDDVRVEQVAFPERSEQYPVPVHQLVATDALGRTLPTHAEVGSPRPDRYVGMFYWLWHRPIGTRTPARNNTGWIAANPQDPGWEGHFNYHWEEPEAGFHRSTDPWVARRNIMMMADAGVDFVFFDYTNDEYYTEELEVYCDVSMELLEQGVQVPRVVFFFNFNPAWKVQKVYEEFYAEGRYRDLWFYWEGKPLLMSPRTGTEDPAVLDYFTWRPTWAFDPAAHDRLFLDATPQDPSLLEFDDGRPEQVTVAKSMGAPLYHPSERQSKGSSATTTNLPPVDEYWLTPETGRGHYFDEQWERAHALDPAIVLVTGWNEWTAGSWPAGEGLANAGFIFMGEPVDEGSIIFIDQFNREYNRDIEPMAGGDTDNYYYQLLAHVIRYKGIAEPQWTAGPRTITIDGDFTGWDGVGPVYTDPRGDVLHRDEASLVDWDNHRYTNTWGRNDIVEAQAAWDADSIYMMARVDGTLAPHAGEGWMVLLLDVDQDPDTGWLGYDFLLQPLAPAQGQVSVRQWDGEQWQAVAETGAWAGGPSALELSVPRAVLGIASGTPAIDFKWIDNPGILDGPDALFTRGDAAPDRRFNYRMQGVAPASLDWQDF